MKSIFCRKGVTDPDYCVLKFIAEMGRHYRDLKTEVFSVDFKRPSGRNSLDSNGSETN